jgi:ABC-type Mn2+/Zn2+ transport system ATPase subunit
MATIRDLIGIIRGWHKDGRTVIAVLHDFAHIRTYFPQTLLLHANGHAWGPTDRVLPPNPYVPPRPGNMPEHTDLHDLSRHAAPAKIRIIS